MKIQGVGRLRELENLKCKYSVSGNVDLAYKGISGNSLLRMLQKRLISQTCLCKVRELSRQDQGISGGSWLFSSKKLTIKMIM